MRLTRRALLPLVAALPFVSWRSSRAQIETNLVQGKIAFVRNGSIWSWSAGTATEILAADNISDPRWSPDGDQLIYTKAGNSFSDLYVVNTVTGVETSLTANQPSYDVGSIEYAQYSSWAIDPDWSQSGLIGFASDNGTTNSSLTLWLISSVNDAPYEALSPETEEDIFDVCLSADGVYAAYAVRVRLGDGSSGTYVALRSLDTGGVVTVAQSSGDQFQPAISPDGAWVSMTIRDKAGVTDLWIVHLESGDRTRLTRDMNASAPRWSNDGSRMAWINMVDFQFEIWVADFNKGNISNETKLYAADGIDPQSGLSWWSDTGSGASPTS